MKQKVKKNIIKKLIKGDLDQFEQQELLESPLVQQKLNAQWIISADSSAEMDSYKVWTSIRKQLDKTNDSVHSVFYKWYSIAASILLLISFGGIAFLSIKEGNSYPMYVVSTGIQNIEKVQLPDGTNVCLGPESRIEYPAQFAKHTREVKLEGQAFFDVEKNPRQPFHIRMKDVKVEVLGTAFEVFNYNDEEDMEVVLLNGKVKFEHRINGRYPQIQVMHPNDRIKLNKQTGMLEKGIVDADKYTSWRSGVLSFKDENLSMIIPRLERWYGRKIICDEVLLNNYRFTFKVRDESLELLLHIMQQSAPIEFRKLEDESYTLKLKR